MASGGLVGRHSIEWLINDDYVRYMLEEDGVLGVERKESIRQSRA
jgi:hypothetical protein